MPETDFNTALTCEAEQTNQQTNEIQPVPELGGEDSLADSYLLPDIFDEFTTFVEYAGLQPTWEAIDLGVTDSTTPCSSLSETEQLKQQHDPKPSAAMEDGGRFAELNPSRQSELTCNTDRSQVPPHVW